MHVNVARLNCRDSDDLPKGKNPDVNQTTLLNRFSHKRCLKSKKQKTSISIFRPGKQNLQKNMISCKNSFIDSVNFKISYIVDEDYCSCVNHCADRVTLL